MKRLNVDAEWLPNRLELERQYTFYEPVFKQVLQEMTYKLRGLLRITSSPTLKTRVKDFESYYRKLLRILPESIYSNDFPTISDNIGIRIICPFLEDVSAVEKKIKESFSVIEIERKGSERAFSEFGYESTHILVHIPDDVRLDKNLPQGLICEIQVRTILQDAWAEVEHELVYKTEFSPFDLPLKRKLASMNASLTLADIIFQEIRDYQNKLNKELDRRRSSFYGQADQELRVSFSPNEGGDLTAETLASASPYVSGTIDDLILEAIRSHNAGDFSRATEIYTKIIEGSTDDKILSVIYKHRGMAYFSQGLYESARGDFEKSAECDSKNSRAYYYVGIVCAVMDDNESAIQAFNNSIAIDSFQPYVYFRRAQSWFHIGDYAKALADLNRADSLGLKKEEGEKFRALLLKRIDI